MRLLSHLLRAVDISGCHSGIGACLRQRQRRSALGRPGAGIAARLQRVPVVCLRQAAHFRVNSAVPNSVRASPK
eukprot:11380319-Alexandrium_andersonii.AAC.1